MGGESPEHQIHTDKAGSLDFPCERDISRCLEVRPPFVFGGDDPCVAHAIWCTYKWSRGRLKVSTWSCRDCHCEHPVGPNCIG
jgi:hypothetical protein